MFTGIVECVGHVLSVVDSATAGRVLTIQVDAHASDRTAVDGGLSVEANQSRATDGAYLDDAQLGDSIAVNGTCLTVTALDRDARTFTVGMAPETLRRTNLGDLTTGAGVNLERAMGVGRRFGGHFVQGHVDCTVRILRRHQERDALWFTLELPVAMRPFIIPKGYVALDGTSLTVCEVNDTEGWFTIMMVAYTQQHVVMPGKEVGASVNLEVDMVGKYVARGVQAQAAMDERALEEKLRAMVERVLNERETRTAAK